ncbi:MAG: hypothetical protein D6798_14450 [Deltaproteobacteria bacterium]|nr:MAG: hypothetical protein D6798_14450 [Deltaproteobacteria bacterium]
MALAAVALVAWLLWPAAPSPAPAPPATETSAPPPVQAPSTNASAVPRAPASGDRQPEEPEPDDDLADEPAVKPDATPVVVSLPIVPRPVRMSRREALGYTNSLRTAILHYQRDHGTWPEPGGPCPPEPPAGEAVPWEGACTAAFDAIDWAPPAGEDGVPMTRCSYAFDITVPDTGRGGGDFRVIARCDGDGDGVISETTATRHRQARRRTADDVY